MLTLLVYILDRKWKANRILNFLLMRIAFCRGVAVHRLAVRETGGGEVEGSLGLSSSFPTLLHSRAYRCGRFWLRDEARLYIAETAFCSPKSSWHYCLLTILGDTFGNDIFTFLKNYFWTQTVRTLGLGNFCLTRYIYSWKVRAYVRSLRSLVRFLIQKQRVSKYPTDHFPCGIVFIMYILIHSSLSQPFIFSLTKLLTPHIILSWNMKKTMSPFENS